MAKVCFAYSLTPPAYWALTLEEHEAMVRLLKKIEKKNG